MRATDQFRSRAGDGLTAAALAITVAIPIWQKFEEYGWLSIALGANGLWYWLAILVWMVSVPLVIRWRRRWWLLLTAPIVLYPAFMAGGLIAACSTGNCL